jgi:hypothetical protein
MVGCATTGGSVVLPKPVLTELGGRLSVRSEAATWEELAAHLKPTFTWDGRDLMWIDDADDGKPVFTMDHAYVLKPERATPKWVLLKRRDAYAPFDKWYAHVMGSNLRGVARLHEKIPTHDTGSGDFAVVLATDPRLGTVYKVGWQKLMANGTSLQQTERRLYLLRKRGGDWVFLGEGVSEKAGKMGYGRSYATTVAARVEWKNRSDPPARVLLTITRHDYEWNTGGAHPSFEARRRRMECRDIVLDGHSADLRWQTASPYVRALQGDTIEGLSRHLASWTNVWEMNAKRPKLRERMLNVWRKQLALLNPDLPDGPIRKGTAVRIPTYAVVRNAFEASGQEGSVESLN